MPRIVKSWYVSSERDELQKDVETICLQQAGVAGSVDISTRMQARRFVYKKISHPWEFLTYKMHRTSKQQ